MKTPRLRIRTMGGFTLIELLIVITIIAILATIGVTGGQVVLRMAREAEAKTVMKGLETAIMSYRTDYLRFPSTDTPVPTEDNAAFDTTDEDGRALLSLLLSRDGPRNPRGERFWQAPPAKSGGAGYSTDHGLRDPWGVNGYRIIIDYGDDGRISNPYAGGRDGEASELTSDVIVYCAGANRTFEDGGAPNGKKMDDVKSWQ
jgi:prepilin-type N-terminal cleavage/methylation domain-containing protein